MHPRSNPTIRKNRLEYRLQLLMNYADNSPAFEFDELMQEIFEIMDELILITTKQQVYVAIGPCNSEPTNN